LPHPSNEGPLRARRARSTSNELLRPPPADIEPIFGRILLMAAVRRKEQRQAIHSRTASMRQRSSRQSAPALSNWAGSLERVATVPSTGLPTRACPASWFHASAHVSHSARLSLSSSARTRQIEAMARQWLSSFIATSFHKRFISAPMTEILPFDFRQLP
jgi:hypothetical protein